MEELDDDRAAGGGGRRRRRQTEQDFEDTVLSWSVEQIRDEGFFVDEVKEVPSRFSSIEQYFESFASALLEETRSELCSSMEDISEAPCSSIVSMEEGQKKTSECTMEYYIDVEFLKNHMHDGSKSYKARNGDLFILSSIEIQSIEDLNMYGVSYCFALATDVSLNEEDEKGYIVKISKNFIMENDISSYRFAFFITNLITNIRIWKALCFTPVLNNNFSIIKQILSPRPMLASECISRSYREVDCLLAKASDKLLSIHLNQSQIDALQAAVHAIKCKASHPVELIWGPPGTGKTNTVSAILWLFMDMKYRTLTCAPTNVAVVGVTSRLLRLVKSTDRQDGLPSSLADVVLFGNRERMELDDELEDVFLDYRVDLLVDCFAPTGWNSRITSLIRLLEDYSSMYDVLLENTDEDVLTFSELLRRQINALQDRLGDCARNLWIHTNCISSETYSKIVFLLRLLEKICDLLCNGDVSDDELREVFSKGSSISSPNSSIYSSVSSELGFSACKSFSEARVEALYLLRRLQATISVPNVSDRDSVRKFCLRGASLIFCTASSSSLLHHVDVDPLEVVVIDEAAQLRECESIIPLRLNGIKNVILVGDECQLPSLVKSQICKAAGFGVSLFQRLGSLGQPKHLLNMQYRMHPSISLFPNSRFYDGQILDAPGVKNVNFNRNYEDMRFGAYAFLNVADGREEMDEKGNSKRNFVEVAVVLHLVMRLFKRWETSSQAISIGVISPYISQVNAITDKLGDKYNTYNGFDLRVKSIDGFQGAENDVIILSTVRSNKKGNVGFLQDQQRANVALTRARHCLWIVGNAETLSRSGTIWQELVHDAKNRGSYFNATDDTNLAKTIMHVKHELNQLDDLLRADSVLLTNARWKVLFSDDFKKSFGKLKQIQYKREVIQLLLKLAEGWRSKHKFKTMSDSFELARVYRIKDLYVVWTVDIMKEARYLQVIKVWDLLPLEQIAKLVHRLDHVFSLYTEDYVKCCKVQCLEGKFEVPKSWNVVRDIVRYRTLSNDKSTVEKDAGNLDPLDYMEHSKVNDSLVLMKFYSLSSGVARHLLTARDGSEIDIPFELTDQEKEILCFPLSTFILGRSGTGKTTVLTMKLVQKERLYAIASEGTAENASSSTASDQTILPNQNSSLKRENFLKQVFITVSSKLCSAIRSHTSRLRSFACGSESLGTECFLHMHDDNADFSDIPDNFSSLKKEHYPLVITFRKLLMMLDGTTEGSFFDKYYSQWRVTPGKQGSPKSIALQAIIQSKEVTYEKFAGSYWPHFNEKLTKTIDCSTVFTQIISHIKGGAESRTFSSMLSREDYLLLSEKRVSTLDRRVREAIYDIFIVYENQKLLSSEYDLSDFVSDLHLKFNRDGYDGDMIDFIYIDEVQDLTVRQIGLLKYICKNFEEGYTFAGDTAQTIARGIDFRFEDIRALFYMEFLSEAKAEHLEKNKESELRMADMFHLNQNFRTHAGVLSLARSVVDLLYYYFPLSVDRLNPEFSLIYGETPVLLESGNDENAILTIFRNTGGMQNDLYGFGAEQVILVRDTNTKEQLFGLVGKQALVLTILECKGLEFQDVLLYNFFGASPLQKKWRVVYEYMKNQDIFESSLSRSCPLFDRKRHNLLCSELKQLYVAVTRTKQRLWICENSDEYSKPMFDYWKKLCLVQVRHLDSSLAQAMKVASSAEDWKQRGIELFNEKNFELAAVCFEKAGDSFNENWARAAGLVANAERTITTNFDMAQIALKQAAEIYESIDKAEIAATCYIKLKDFNKAGMIYMEKCGSSRLKEAGDCFAMAESWSLAADAYAKGKFISECLSVCSRGGIFDKGLQLIERLKRESDSDKHQHKLNKMISSYLKDCALHYLELGDIGCMMTFLKAFKSDDVPPFLALVRNTLKSKNLLDDLLRVEQELGNYTEAASIARIKGNVLLEVELLGKAKCFDEAIRLLLFHVLMKSLWPPGNNGWPLKNFAEKEDLLNKAKELAKCMPGSAAECFILDADILSSRKKSLSEMSSHFCEAHKYKNLRQEIFSARAVLDAHILAKPSDFSCRQDLAMDSEKLVFESMSLNNHAPETILYFWNVWKARVLNLLSYLQHPEPAEENNSTFEEFYLEYFGVKKVDNGDCYVIHNPEARWAKRRGKTMERITAGEFISCALVYWSNELCSVGEEVLKSLLDLHAYFKRQRLYSFCRVKLAIWIYEVAKFFSESEFPSCKAATNIFMSKGIAQSYLDTSTKLFFGAVFPVDWRDDSNENLKLLHESNVAVEMVEASIDRILGDNISNLTHGQIGRLVMLLLVRGKLPVDWCQKIVDRLNTKQKWREFFEQYHDFLGLGFAKIPVITRLQIALESTFNADWKKEIDYMSPHCFIYLMESLLFFAASCQGFGGQFFTTKSCLVEMLKCNGSRGYIYTSMSVVSGHLQSSILDSIKLIVRVAQYFLINLRQMCEWINRSSMPGEVRSLLTQKLIIILYLSYLNSGGGIYEVRNFLRHHRVFSHLPSTSFNRLQYAPSDKPSFLKVFAETLVMIENPLVIISSPECRSRLSVQNALTITSEDMRCRGKLSLLLFPEMKVFSQDPSNSTDQDIGFDKRRSESKPMDKTPVGMHQDIGSMSLLVSDQSDPGSGLGAGDADQGLAVNHKNFWEKLEEFLSGNRDDAGDEVENLITEFGTSLERIRQVVESKDGDGSFILAMKNMHEELKLFAKIRSEGTQHPTKSDLHSKWKVLRRSLELHRLCSGIVETTDEASWSDKDNDIDDHNHSKLNETGTSLEPQMIQSQLEDITREEAPLGDQNLAESEELPTTSSGTSLGPQIAQSKMEEIPQEEAPLSDENGDDDDEAPDCDQNIAESEELPTTSSGSQNRGGKGKKKANKQKQNKKSGKKGKKNNRKK